VTYDRAANTAWLCLRKEFGGEQIEVPIIRLGHAQKRGRVPRIARLMALAIRCEELVRTGVVADYSELARLGIVTRARITQLMNLLNLAPTIQEEILFLPDLEGGREPVTEGVVRKLPALLGWEAQAKAWQKLRNGRACVFRAA
jgi:hypothetical protein